MKNRLTVLTVLFLITGVSGVGAVDAVDSIDAIVSESTGTKLAISDLYQGDRYRDPFQILSAREVSITREETEFSLETFSIHSLKLKGLMREKAGNYAILIEEGSGMGFMLRKRRLYTYQNEMIPGVSGRINIAQKSVTLITDEKDVQTLRLGEDEEDAEDEGVTP